MGRAYQVNPVRQVAFTQWHTPVDGRSPIHLTGRRRVARRRCVTDPHKTAARRTANRQSRIPANSFFYERVIPAILLGLGVITVLLILVAVGIVLGMIPFR